MVQMNRAQETSVRAVAPSRSRLARLSTWLGNPWGYLLVLPSVLLYVTFEIWPIIRGLMMAFSPFGWVVPETKGLLVFNGLDNYREPFRTQEWRYSMWISMKFTAGALPANVIFAMLTAVPISKVTNPRWAGFLRIVSYLPVVLPISTAVLLWRNLYYGEYGYINYLLKTALHIKNPPNWLWDPRWAIFSAMIAAVWEGFGHNTLMFLVGIYRINRELYEAAEIDGRVSGSSFGR